MPSSGSASLSRARHGAGGILALLLLSALLTGCPKDPGSTVLPPAEDRLLREKGDDLLRKAVQTGEPLPFAVVARFRQSVFPGMAVALEQLGLETSESVGRTALIVASGKEVLALLKSPETVSIRFLCGQAVLARLHPALEMGILNRVDREEDDTPLSLFVRFESEPGREEELAVAGSGYSADTKAGTVWTVHGAFRDLPRLLAIESIIYFEAASNARKM
jgi:hypothetical protein